MATPTRSSASLAASQAPASASSHSTRTGRRLPSSPLQEGLGERAHDRRHAHRGVPVAVVPLDAVAGRELVLRRALARPPRRSRRRTSRARPRARRPPGRRSTARSARRSGCPRRTPSAGSACTVWSSRSVSSRPAPSSDVAEVARHPQRRAAGALLPRAEPQPASASAREQGGRGTPHGTVGALGEGADQAVARGHGAVAARRQRQPRHPVRVGGGRHAAGAHGRARRRARRDPRRRRSARCATSVPGSALSRSSSVRWQPPARSRQ